LPALHSFPRPRGSAVVPVLRAVPRPRGLRGARGQRALPAARGGNTLRAAGVARADVLRDRGVRRAALLGALFLAALSLRPQLVGAGPLIPSIQSDLGVSHAVAGLLGTIPVLCMGLFAPPAPHLSRWVGSRAAIAACVAAIGVFGLARAVVPGSAGALP